MSQATRFIMLAVAGWIGLRAVSLGMVPGGAASAGEPRGVAPLPALVATEFAALAPVAPEPLVAPPPPPPAFGYAPYPVPFAIPAFHAGASRGAAALRPAASFATPERWGPDEAAAFSLAPAASRYADATLPLDQWPLADIARGPTSRRAQSTPADAIRAIPGIDRLSMSAWAMMRRDPGPASLATNGQLGGSQAGARFLWRFDPRLAASIRSSAPIGGVQRSAELAGGGCASSRSCASPSRSPSSGASRLAPRRAARPSPCSPRVGCTTARSSPASTSTPTSRPGSWACATMPPSSTARQR